MSDGAARLTSPPTPPPKAEGSLTLATRNCIILVTTSEPMCCYIGDSLSRLFGTPFNSSNAIWLLLKRHNQINLFATSLFSRAILFQKPFVNQPALKGLNFKHIKY